MPRRVRSRSNRRGAAGSRGVRRRSRQSRGGRAPVPASQYVFLSPLAQAVPIGIQSFLFLPGSSGLLSGLLSYSPGTSWPSPTWPGSSSGGALITGSSAPSTPTPGGGGGVSIPKTPSRETSV
jgi:hypothetical protein